MISPTNLYFIYKNMFSRTETPNHVFKVL